MFKTGGVRCRCRGRQVSKMSCILSNSWWYELSLFVLRGAGVGEVSLETYVLGLSRDGAWVDDC